MKKFRGRKIYKMVGYPAVTWREHPMASENSGGYVYIHRIIAYEKYGEIPEGHEVHHIDGDRSNYSPDNLEIVSKSEHIRKHHKNKEVTRSCSNCGNEVITTTKRRVSQQDIYCDQKCFKQDQERIEWPSTNRLKTMVENNSFLAIGRKLGVSDNAIRKRLENHT